MLIQIPEGFPEGYNEGLNLILWELMILSLALMLPFGYRSASKAELENVKIVERGRGWFGFFYAMGRLFFLFAMKIDNGNKYDLLVTIGYVFSMIGLTALIYTYERYKLSRRGLLFSLIGAIASFITLTGFDIIPGIFFTRQQIMSIIAVASAFLLLLVAKLYFDIAERFPGLLRQRTLYEFFGLLLVIIGIIMDGEKVLVNPDVPWFFKMIYPPVMALFGVWIVLFSHDGAPWAYKSLTVVCVFTLFMMFFLHLSDLGVKFYV